MKPLSLRMVEALRACPSEWERCPTYTVREQTRCALEDRGLVEFDHRKIWLDMAGRESAARYVFWRRTVAGENLALELLMDEEARSGAVA